MFTALDVHSGKKMINEKNKCFISKFLSKYFFKALVLFWCKWGHQWPPIKVQKTKYVNVEHGAEHYGILSIFLAFQLIILIDELGQGFKRSSSCVIKCYTMHIMSLHNILAELKRALKSPQKPGKPRCGLKDGNLNNSAIFSTFPFKIQIVHLVEFNASNTLEFFPRRVQIVVYGLWWPDICNTRMILARYKTAAAKSHNMTLFCYEN